MKVIKVAIAFLVYLAVIVGAFILSFVIVHVIVCAGTLNELLEGVSNGL